MSLAYTAPTWTDGSGEGISASNLQAISNCIEGLVQGTDKAVHNVSINGSMITLTYADGTSDSFEAVSIKGIASIEKISTVGLQDIYAITYTDGTSTTFTITNGEGGDMYTSDYDSDDTVKDAGGIVDYVEGYAQAKPTIKTATLAANATSVTFTQMPTTGNNIIKFYIEGGANYTGIDTTTAGQVTLTYDAENVSRAVYCVIEEV